jgi:serine/threonine protein kinase
MLDGRYRIGRVLGHGGFGITYLAWDENLQLRLAIKEYLPRDSASRAPDGVSLAVYSGRAGEQFTYGLERFLEEARALAHFVQHPGIVTVTNFFRAHGTGYCVTDYVEGITLGHYLEQQPGGRISVVAALKLLTPVMDALWAVHKEGLLHRDLSPDNIYISRSGRVELLDFGAARFAAGEHSKSLSIILKPGYAPEEQYRTKGNQGPWTDVYGLAATFYRAITGQLPPESLDRLEADELAPPSALGVDIQPEQETVLLKALAVRAAQRYPSITEFQEDWSAADLGAPKRVTEQEVGVSPEALPSQSVGDERSRESAPVLAYVALAAVLLAAVAFLWRPDSETTPQVASSPPRGHRDGSRRGTRSRATGEARHPSCRCRGATSGRVPTTPSRRVSAPRWGRAAAQTQNTLFGKLIGE